MFELPLTKCMKEHYEKNNVSFTDSERATIFWNSRLSRCDKLAALREILDTTLDEELKEQIRNRLTCEAEEERKFMCDGKGFAHMVTLDDSDRVDRVFSSLGVALTYGKEECDETFRIDKELMEDVLEAEPEEGTTLGGRATFKKSGELITCDCFNARGCSFAFLNLIQPESFEEAYIPVLNPFEYGDLVRIVDDDRLGIVVTSQKSWNERLERRNRSDLPRNYYENTVTVEFLYSDGEFDHGHPDIFDLEKVEEWNNEAEWKFMKSLSVLMKGEGWPESVFELYNRNKTC